ncbi:MAG: hypothetical protein QOE77_2815 [Blastocatellia bacterium]|jgi:hypothetical protein|nr:hypothetical protein [Blastocatellia bacterium]
MMHKLIVAVFVVALAAISIMGQSPTLRIVSDDPHLPADLFYGNVKVKPLRLRPGTNVPITIDDTDFFINQNYVDFLNRFPDQGGFDYWVGSFAQCGTNQTCISDRRVRVSAAFFIEQEFQDTGSFVYRFYQGSLGRHPTYKEFMPDRRLVIGGSSLEAKKAAFAEAWVQRPAFLTQYPATMTNAQFVDAILATMKNANGGTGTDLTSSRGTFISQLDGGATRGQVVRNIIDNQTFATAEYNAAFVLMQYFGYLRRDAEPEGYAFWLNVVNNRAVNNYLGMVCSFVTSAEFQLRFGSSVTHSNAECGVY